jgi:2-keto-4-pentenoate hydratase/2-oxohepta-3-ene-1,7-dioic acid hydratase in catechol pathway
MGGPAPASPVIFLKPSTAVVGPEDGIVYPVTATRVDYEGELAVVIGRICRRIGAAEALDYVLGYMCGNDVTARDQQAADGQWARAKGHDTFCPLGPWIETDVDPADVKVTTLLNGEVRQEATTASLLHSVPTLIEFVSAVMTLLPGDVLLTGTPEGVGPMSVGDEVSVRIDGIGALTNRVISGG